MKKTAFFYLDSLLSILEINVVVELFRLTIVYSLNPATDIGTMDTQLEWKRCCSQFIVFTYELLTPPTKQFL